MSTAEPTLDRRELLESMVRALDRRHEVLDEIIKSNDRDGASAAVGRLLGIPAEHVEAVLALPLWRLNQADLRGIQQELEDVNSALDWIAPAEREVRLRLFTGADTDRELYRDRATEPRADGSTLHAPDEVDSAIVAGMQRIADESAAWFVAEDPQDADARPVGLVVGELIDGEVEVRLWVCRDCRSQGFGTSALKQVRRELAAFFPGANLVVRTPIGSAK